MIAYAKTLSVNAQGLPALIAKALPHLIDGKSPATIKQYNHAAKQLSEIYSEFCPEQLKHGHIVQMMDAFKESPSVANVLLSVLRLVYRWALDRDLVESDPTIRVRRSKQEARDRLISQEEYNLIYAASPVWLQCVMDVCFLTGQRIGDVLRIQRTQLTEEGIFFTQQKTGKKLIVAWSPELKDVLSRARTMHGSEKDTEYVLHTKQGKPYIYNTVRYSFSKVCQSVGIENITLHDIRAMAGTVADSQGIDPQALLGHSDHKTTKIYLRDKTVQVVQGPTKKLSGIRQNQKY